MKNEIVVYLETAEVGMMGVVTSPLPVSQCVFTRSATRTLECAMSPELETLDQLQNGDLPLSIIANLFPSPEDFGDGVCGLLSSGDVIITMLDGTEVPEWRWRELFRQQSVFGELERLRPKITPQGVRRIG